MKKISSKIPSFVAVALLGAVVLTGCGGTNTSDYVGDPTQLSATVTFWHTMGQANQDVLNAMIAEFNEVYPNIKIEHSIQGGYDELRDKVSSAIPAGTTPTMAYCYPDHVADYMSAGAVEELTKYVEDDVIGLGVADDPSGALGVDDFIQAYWDEGRGYSQEGIYSLPFSKSTEVMFYNKTVFEQNSLEVPTTWDEVITVSRALKALYPTTVPFGYDSDANWFITLCEQMGIPYTSVQEGNNFLFNNDRAKALVGQMKQWYDEKLIVTQGTSANNEYTSNQFVAQKLFMAIGSTGGTRYNFSENFEVGVAAVPQYEDPDTHVVSQKVISQGPSVTIFKRASANQKTAAWLFYKWITNTTNSAVYSVLSGYNPVRTSSFASPIYTTEREVVADTDSELIKQVADFVPTIEDWYYTSPAFKGSSTARAEVGGIIANVLLGLKTVEEAFTDALTTCVFSTEA